MVTRALPRGALPPRRDGQSRSAASGARGQPKATTSLTAAFDRALDSMSMVLQPILRASDLAVYGYEALLRTADPDLPHPGAMLEAAEKLRRIHVLSRRIRALTADRFAAEKIDSRLLFVNLHAADFIDTSLAAGDSPLAPISGRVVFEITERASLDEIPDIRARVAELREMGYRIAIDDLGAGHSRSNLFRPLDTDFVKLDMSLVRGIEASPSKRELVATIVRSCEDRGIGVVGEGVETEEEAQTLIELGCDLLQGFYFGRPG